MRLRTFGAVYLEQDGAPLGGAHSQRRRLALLAYLAAARGAAITRDKLIALLWPESDSASGRHSLSQLLYALRHDLGADVIAIDSETVRLIPTALPSDVLEFTVAVNAGKFEEAAESYRGPFLDGFHVDDAPEFDRWSNEVRSHCAAECARALDQLAESAQTSGQWHCAAEWCRRRVALDPTDGRATLRYMRNLAEIGDREGALRVARIYESLVRGDLEAEPDAAVVQLVEQLRRAPAGTAPNVDSVADTSAATAVAPADSTHLGVTTARVERRRRPPIRTWVAVGTAVLATVLLGIVQLRREADITVDRTTASGAAIVVVGQLDGPDTVLSLAVREALRAELTNSRGVVLTSDLGLRELTTLMRLPPAVALQPPQLLALAARAGAHVTITGSVVPVGNGAQIVVELLEPSSGKPLRTYTERPVDAVGILKSVERIARSIASAISRAGRDTTVRPLPAVTTASLPALKSYAQARQLAAAGRREDAIAPAERALSHDSAFVLAHYFLGDLLWFIDEQSHSEAHLTKAYQLLATVAAREQLVIRARYEQLANDRPDSALAYWDMLHDASPGDVLAYEGRAWALRALGRHEEAAASADTAMHLDPAAVAPNTNNAMYSLFGVGDTTGALAVAQRVAERNPDAVTEARFVAAAFRGDAAAVLQEALKTRSPFSRHWRLHHAYLIGGDLARARVALDSILKDNRVQFPPNALLNQGYVELALGENAAGASRYAQRALEWLRARDLSPPAVGRLAERIACLAAKAGDERTIRETIALVRARDRGRGLRSYGLASHTLDAALAFTRRDYAEAAQRAEAARHGVYFGRSLATIVQLESDARRAAGEIAVADSLERLITTHQIVDGHFEVWMILK
ncbi:MAG: BTAD domain-containing putative transcriptional regulator, partial [Gemmatimonadota bacterium]